VSPLLEGSVLEELRRIARVDLDYQGPLEPQLRLKEDLQLDSMAMIVVAVGLENRFRVKLDEGDAGALLTVEDLVRLVTRRVDEAGSAAS
jgi:acyl carrier protein